jgi:alkylation response protein AidB-like acyl-CoA dehydrogenase
MDFRLPAENDPRRAAVRNWLSRHPKPSGRQLAEAGYTVPHWPKPWGLAAEPELQFIVDEELCRAGVMPPNLINPVAINNCAQTLLTHGTDAQRERFLMPALACEEIWCMLFSEPAGGSDLAALRTTARRDGDHYVVKGQKIWTSLAHKAQVGVLVARTDTAAPKHAGLSAFLIDMNSPGVTVRPIIDLSGHENEYNEVFLDDVRIPADRLLGKEGEGWRIATSQLADRARGALQARRDLGGGAVGARPRQWIGRVGTFVRSRRARRSGQDLHRRRIVASAGLPRAQRPDECQDPGPEGAIRKMLAAPHGQHIVEMAKKVQGPRGMIAGEQPFPTQVGAARACYDGLGLCVLVQPGRDAGRRHAGDPQEHRGRTDAGAAARKRSHGETSLDRNQPREKRLRTPP